MYALFSLIAGLCLVAAAAALADWPALATPALCLLLLLTLLAWVLAAAATLLLRTGTNVCAGLETLLLNVTGALAAGQLC